MRFTVNVEGGSNSNNKKVIQTCHDIMRSLQNRQILLEFPMEEKERKKTTQNAELPGKK